MRILGILLCFLTLSPCVYAQSSELLRQFRKMPREKSYWQPLLDALISEGERQKALEVAQEILKVDVLYAYAMGKHAYLLLVHSKKEEEAKKAAQRTLNYFNGNVDALHTLAWYHYLNKDYEASYRHFREIRDKEIMDFELQYHWGLSAWKAAKPEEAMARFRIALKLEPNNIPCLLSVALFLEERQRPKQAVSMYNKALQHSPETGPLRDFITDKLRSLLPSYQKPEGVESTLEPISDNTDRFRNLLARYGRAETLAPPENNPKTLPAIRKPRLPKTQSNPITKTSTTAGTIVSNPFHQPILQKVYEEKRAESETLGQEQYHNLGELFLKEGLKREAIAELETAISLNRSNPTARSARTLLDSAYELPEMSLVQRIDALFNIAEDFYRRGSKILSRYLFQKILLLDEKHPRARKNLAYLYLELNQPVSALPILDSLIEEYPEYQEALILHGYCMARLRRFKEASDSLRRAAESGGGLSYSNEYASQIQELIRAYEKPLPELD
ncbi:MAG: tetratricopeptide repeat protein [Candidatus Cloacimonetes bacterium]|nr:tetratricopeptide repeat protein [Candidatus Cloacimonadota bacterium]